MVHVLRLRRLRRLPTALRVPTTARRRAGKLQRAAVRRVRAAAAVRRAATLRPAVPHGLRRRVARAATVRPRAVVQVQVHLLRILHPHGVQAVATAVDHLPRHHHPPRHHAAHLQAVAQAAAGDDKIVDS